jgi:hypothetical protein
MYASATQLKIFPYEDDDPIQLILDLPGKTWHRLNHRESSSTNRTGDRALTLAGGLIHASLS